MPRLTPALICVGSSLICAALAGGCLDNDDGSSWYNIYENFCVYGAVWS